MSAKSRNRKEVRVLCLHIWNLSLQALGELSERLGLTWRIDGDRKICELSAPNQETFLRLREILSAAGLFFEERRVRI